MPCARPWKRDRPKRESQRFGHQRPPSLHRMENGMDADDALNLNFAPWNLPIPNRPEISLPRQFDGYHF